MPSDQQFWVKVMVEKKFLTLERKLKKTIKNIGKEIRYRQK